MGDSLYEGPEPKTGNVKMFQMRSSAWRAFASEIGAQTENGVFGSVKSISARSGLWSIKLDLYRMTFHSGSVTFTRFRVPFRRKGALQFQIHRRNLLATLFAAWSEDSLSTGDPLFDQHFITRGTDEARIKAFLASKPVRAGLLSERRISLAVYGADDQDRSANALLECQVKGVVKSAERLRTLFRMMTDAMEQLGRIGVVKP